MTIIDPTRTVGPHHLRASEDSDPAELRQRLLASARERLGRVRGQMDDATFDRLLDQVVTLKLRWQQRLHEELRGSARADARR
jgi:hypothetical protein